MKSLFSILTVVSAATCLFSFSSCTKQIDKDLIAENQASAFSATPSCRVVSQSYVSEAGFWINEMQKWYGDDGRVAFLKANPSEGHSLPWGVVTYHNNNQVYLKDATRLDTVLRVTLDANQKPAASYYRINYLYTPFIDTSYYYFTGNRLDSILSIFQPFLDKTAPTFRKLLFSYDMYGNLVRIYETYDGGSSGLNDRWEFFYDYTKPVTGMLPSFSIDRPYRLMQYLDLLNFPMHHQLKTLSRTLLGLTYRIDYSNYQLLDNGLVYSYKHQFVPVPGSASSPVTFYTGWDCTGPEQVY